MAMEKPIQRLLDSSADIHVSTEHRNKSNLDIHNKKLICLLGQNADNKFPTFENYQMLSTFPAQ